MKQRSVFKGTVLENSLLEFHRIGIDSNHIPQQQELKLGELQTLEDLPLLDEALGIENGGTDIFNPTFNSYSSSMRSNYEMNLQRSCHDVSYSTPTNHIDASNLNSMDLFSSSWGLEDAPRSYESDLLTLSGNFKGCKPESSIQGAVFSTHLTASPQNAVQISIPQYPNEDSFVHRNLPDNCSILVEGNEQVKTNEAKSPKNCGFRTTESYTQQNTGISISITDSSVTCLSVGIDYGGYTGSILELYEDNPHLVNSYCNEHDYEAQRRRATKIYSERNGPLSPISAARQRTKYVRNIDAILNAIQNIVYKTSSVFNLLNPYEPQYYRFEVDDTGNLINESKCGLCSYCEEVKFLPFKNSSYLSHLTLEHGVFSNNYLTPNGVYYGTYNIKKEKQITNKKGARVREVEAIQCPECFEVIEVGCWSMKSNKLLSYFRHFKNKHGDKIDILKDRARQTPYIRARGRTLKVIN